MDESYSYVDGMKKGQLIMIETIRSAIKLNAPIQSIERILNEVEKSLIGDKDENS